MQNEGKLENLQQNSRSIIQYDNKHSWNIFAIKRLLIWLKIQLYPAYIGKKPTKWCKKWISNINVNKIWSDTKLKSDGVPFLHPS